MPAKKAKTKANEGKAMTSEKPIADMSVKELYDRAMYHVDQAAHWMESALTRAREKDDKESYQVLAWWHKHSEDAWSGGKSMYERLQEKIGYLEEYLSESSHAKRTKGTSPSLESRALGARGRAVALPGCPRVMAVAFR